MALATAALSLSIWNYTQKKIYMRNISADLDRRNFSSFSRNSRRLRKGCWGFLRLFAYRSPESVRRALEEPHKDFEGSSIWVWTKRKSTVKYLAHTHQHWFLLKPMLCFEVNIGFWKTNVINHQTTSILIKINVNLKIQNWLFKNWY